MDGPNWSLRAKGARVTIELAVQTNQGQFELDVTATISSRGMSALFGPSGCGKSTLLRCICGIQEHLTGSIKTPWGDWLQGSQNVSPWQRGVGMVFQQACLFPHLKVRQNLAYSIKRSPGKHSHRSIEQQLDEIAELTGVGQLLRHYPAQLSGGQQQRVAIARALLSQPRMLLLDEPLASLDTSARHDFIVLLRQIHEQTGLPMLYVSHQIEEVAYLADELHLMKNGTIVESGRLNQVLQSPLGVQLSGGLNMLELHHQAASTSYTLIPNGQLMEFAQAMTTQRALVYADNISLSLHPVTQTSIRNQLRALVQQVSPHPTTAGLQLVSLSIDAQPLLAAITQQAVSELRLQPGQQVIAMIKAAALHG